MNAPHENLKVLGNKVVQPHRYAPEILEAIPNHWKTNYVVELVCEEFTCLCPLTGQPDFAQIVIEYTPDEKLVESKALKLYLGSFRNEGIFHEYVINQICADLAILMNPKNIKIRGEFKPRGGIRIVPTAYWNQEMPKPVSDLPFKKFRAQ